MPLGPLQLFVVAFDQPALDGSLLAEVNALRDQGLVRLVESLAVYKDSEGNISTLEATDLSYDEYVGVGHTLGALIGLRQGTVEAAEDAAAQAAINADYMYEHGLSEERIAALADQIPAGGGALLMLVEHAWLKSFRDVVRSQGGLVLAQDFLTAEALLGLN